jgi:hypothetical protein
MKLSELERKLDEIKVPEEVYSLLKGGLPNEQMCIVKNIDNWEIYYSERGRKTGIKIFEDEDSACNYFFEKMKKYSRL